MGAGADGWDWPEMEKKECLVGGITPFSFFFSLFLFFLSFVFVCRTALCLGLIIAAAMICLLSFLQELGGDEEVEDEGLRDGEKSNDTR